MRTLVGFSEHVGRAGAWGKFSAPKVSRGRTVFPLGQRNQVRLGIRFDYDSTVTRDGVLYHKFQVQPNAGDVSSSIMDWRQKNGGTHAVMAVMYVRDGAPPAEVAATIERTMRSI